MTLIETVLVSALSAVLLAAFAAYDLARKPYAVSAAVQSIGSLLDDARSVAQTSGNGATLLIASSGDTFTASLYPYRPLTGADLTVPAVRTLRGNVSITPSAIFIDSSGTTSWDLGWTPLSGTLDAEPACTSPAELTFGDGSSSETHAVPCAAARLQ